MLSWKSAMLSGMMNSYAPFESGLIYLPIAFNRHYT